MTRGLPAKKLLFFFGGLTIFAAALAVGVNFLLLRLTPQEECCGVILPAIQYGDTPPQNGSDGVETRIIVPRTADPRAVSYTVSGFEPHEVTVRSGDLLGCLITVVNRSTLGMRLGVNPHDPSGDPGANYGDLIPGQVGIYDVRYSGFDVILLHNHLNPAQEFRVRYGDGCR